MEQYSFDPSLNFLQSYPSVLDPLFTPKTIAVIGATETENSVGRTLMQNLMKNSGNAKIFPIHPSRDAVFNLTAYKSVTLVTESIDLAIIVTPAATVPKIIQECVEKKIKAAIIISAGFKEMGPSGIALENQILQIAKNKIRIIGPNCLGIMNPIIGLNATFAADMAMKGNLAFISQSGALCTAVLDWSLQEKVGFSSFVSIGSMADIDFGDLIHYFGNDPNTHSILLYIESIGDARSFLSAAKEVALTKPIILIKAGKTSESAKAAASHTGSLSGSDDALTCALNRVGVLRVDTIAELFAIAEVLAKQPYPKGPNLSIITNAGGPGVIATDALIQNGGKLAPVSGNALQEFSRFLPAAWSHNNPIDILGDASPDRYVSSCNIACNDAMSDGVLIILTPQDMTDPTETAKLLSQFSNSKKTILASWMGGKRVEKGNQILAQCGIPTFAFPDMACQIFGKLSQYAYHLESIYEVPSQIVSQKIDYQAVDNIIQKALAEKRTILDEFESKMILKAYALPIVPTFIAKTKQEAISYAKDMQFPLVVKLYSQTITHKSDVGGVKLNLKTVEEVGIAFDEIFIAVSKFASVNDFKGVTIQPMVSIDGYELILGSSFDSDFGPVLLFGLGGQLVEIFKDRSLGLPPLTTTLARKMIQSTKIYEALKGTRGKSAINFEKLEQFLVLFSRLVSEQKWIKEIDINPFVVSADQMIALDARIILHDENANPIQAAIAPYPIQYVETVILKNGQEVVLRPIRPDDEPKMIQFHKTLSQKTVRQRYLEFVHLDERVAHNFLKRMCFIDFEREVAIVAEVKNQIIGVARITKVPIQDIAVITITIEDGSHGLGLGTKFLDKIIGIAKKLNVKSLQAQMLNENKIMQHLMKNKGFSLEPKGNLVLAEKFL